MRSLCIFCGSSVGNDPVFASTVKDLGELLARREITLVYGGGCVGLMGVLADACLAAGGKVVGVIPRFLADRELAHESLTETVLVDTMHERKAEMARRAEGFMALPGGFGTLDELCEALTWAQVGLHNRPTALLNVGGLFDGFLACLDKMVAADLLRPEHRGMLLVGDQLEPLLDRMVAYKPRAAAKLPGAVGFDQL